MFLLDGKPLSPDVAFTATDPEGEVVQYPLNWLRLATPEERAAIGITEVPDPPVYDQRFYWGYDADGALIPMDHTMLVERWTANTRTAAGTLLTPTDWQVIREADNGTAMSTAIKTWRQNIRTACEEKITAISATIDTAELAAYITGADYFVWPVDPNAVFGPASTDGI